MDAATFLALAAVCAPLVDPSTSHAIVLTESSLNPHAIGVVAGSLGRQPVNRDEALATARYLQADGFDISVGLAQINARNLDRFGMSLADGFDACKNLGAMQSVLVDCFGRAASEAGPQTTLRRALSCYYSGNFSTGFRHGYVQRVVDSARRLARAPP